MIPSIKDKSFNFKVNYTITTTFLGESNPHINSSFLYWYIKMSFERENIVLSFLLVSKENS